MIITVETKKLEPPFPRLKIRKIIQSIMPKGQTFDLKISDSGIRKMQIVRIVTWAWKKLCPADRIEKVLDAIAGKLSPQEEKRILRFSVLTPNEYENVTSAGVTKLLTNRNPNK